MKRAPFPDDPDTRATSIEAFAALSATLADPFAQRDAVLAAYGLTDAEWESLSEAWRQVFSVDSDAARAYAVAYAAVRRGVADRDLTEVTALPGSIPSASLPFVAGNPASVRTRIDAMSAGSRPASPPGGLLDTEDESASPPATLPFGKKAD